MIAINPGISFGMQSKIVDEFWHTLIECTALYRNFCTAIAGRFIDHDPEGGGDANYQRTLNAYQIAFGEQAPQDIWPRIEQEERKSSQVNGQGQSTSNDSGDFITIPAMIFYSDNGHQDTGSFHSSSDSDSNSSHSSDGGSHGCSGGDGGGGCGGGGGE